MKSTKSAVFASSIFNALLSIYILYYVNHLEKIGCECAVDSRRHFITVYLWIALIYAVFSMVLLPAKDHIVDVVYMITVPIMFFLGLTYLYMAWTYVDRLRVEKCACSESIARTVWQIVLVIQIALLAMIMISIFLGVIVAIIALTKSKSKTATLTSTLNKSLITPMKKVITSKK